MLLESIRFPSRPSPHRPGSRRKRRAARALELTSRHGLAVDVGGHAGLTVARHGHDELGGARLPDRQRPLPASDLEDRRAVANVEEAPAFGRALANAQLPYGRSIHDELDFAAADRSD